MRTLADARRGAARRDRRVPGPHGHDDDRPRARHEPVPGPARVSRRIQAPRGTYDVLGEQAAAREALEGHARGGSSSARATRASRRPTFEATELFARGVGESTDVVQKEMYTLDGGEGDEHHAAPRGHRAGLPRLPRARHAQAAAAGEALVPVELLPPRAPAEGPLPPVLAGRRGGDRLRRPGRRRRVDPAARRAARGARLPRPAAADRLARHARDAARLPRGAAGVPARARGASWPRRSSRGSTSTRCARSTPTTAARSR